MDPSVRTPVRASRFEAATVHAGPDADPGPGATEGPLPPEEVRATPPEPRPTGLRSSPGRSAYRYTAEMVGTEQDADDRSVVTARLVGDFPRSVDLPND